MPQPRPIGARRDGFAPIGDYAAIGDGRTVALVASDAAIDWLPLPTIDAPPSFAALLDPEKGGSIRIDPVGATRVVRRYVEDTNVLETTLHSESGSVRITDSLNVGDAGRLPWNELVRRIEGVEGTVDVRWEVAVGNRFDSAQPWACRRGEAALIRIADQMMAVTGRGLGESGVDGHRVTGSFEARAGSRHLLVVSSTDGEPVPAPPADEAEARLEATIEAWRRWCRKLPDGGRWAEAVRRSALALKLLIHAPTGAIAAAPTTSLPERIGAGRNYDYRFAWVRDMSFVVESLIRLGLGEEVHGSLSWLLSAVTQTAPEVRVLYKLGGQTAETEFEVNLRGYRDSRPVRSGNAAAQQVQLGVYGDLLEPTLRYVEEGNHLDGRTAQMIAACADRVCDIWQRADSGLWELDDQEHYTSSKIGCWAALDRACRLADAGELSSLTRERWALERTRVAEWVHSHCWSEAKQAFSFHSGTDDLDAAVLLAARTGFDCGPRLSSTIDAIRAELGRGPLLYRYTGMQEKEGAFLVCSFWLVEALSLVGRVGEATDLMDELVDLTNDVGLLSEEMDPTSHEMLGNFPLGLTHLGLVNAAATANRSRPA